MKTIKLFRVLAAPGALLCAVLLSGCVSANVTYRLTGEQRNPVPVESVRIVEKVPKGSLKIAELVAKANESNQKAADADVESLKKTCAQLGGNRLVMGNSKITDHQAYWMAALAFWVRE